MELGINKMPWWGQLALYFMLATGAAGAYYYFVHVDQQAQLARQQKELAGIQAEIARGQAQERRLPEFRAEVAELVGRLDALKAVLPEQKDVGELLRRIQTLATQSRLTIRGFKPQAVAVKQQHAEWPISVQLEGTYHDLGSFFDKVSRLPRIINITGIEIKARNDRDADASVGSVAANCTVTTFVLSDPAATPAPVGRAGRAGAAGGRPPAAAR